MRTRPPKFKRHPTPSEVYAELSGLLVGAGCEPLPTKQRPSWSVVPDLHHTFVDIPPHPADAERMGRLVLSLRRSTPLELYLDQVRRLSEDHPLAAIARTGGNPCALNLNVSTDVPTLETM